MPFLSSHSFSKLFSDQSSTPSALTGNHLSGAPLMLPVAQGALPLTESLSCSHLFLLVPEERLRFLGLKVWNVLLWKEAGKRWKICMRLRDSRVQLLQRMTKVENQKFWWKIHKCLSACTAWSSSLCPYQHFSVLSLWLPGYDRALLQPSISRDLPSLDHWHFLSKSHQVHVTHILNFKCWMSWVFKRLWQRLGEMSFEQRQCGYPEKSHLGLAGGAFCSSCLPHILL